MESLTFSEERTAIRFRVDGSWTCDQFGEFLLETNEIYRRVNSVYILNEAILFEDRKNELLRQNDEYNNQSFMWRSQIFGSDFRHHMGVIASEPPGYSKLIDLANSVSEPLTIDAISYASPGWIQMIGDWNPLKVLADFISNWRSENTVREDNRRKAENEDFRIRADLAARLIESAPNMQQRHEGESSRLIDLAEHVINPTTKYIENVKRDSRIIDVEIVNPNERLPTPRKIRKKG